MMSVPGAVVLLILLQPAWFSRVSDGQWKALATLGGISIVVFKLFQGFYYAKLDLELTVDLAPASKGDGVLVIVRLCFKNVGSANVGIKEATLTIDDRPAGDSKSLGF